MSSILVAKFENKRDASFVASLIKKFRKNAKVFQGEAWEDLYLGEMIEEAMKEKGDEPLDPDVPEVPDVPTPTFQEVPL